MRVFQHYYFDLGKQILFKDTLPYVEAWLVGQGIAYGGMAFSMHFINCDEDRDALRVLARFPRLEKYYRPKVSVYEPPLQDIARGARVNCTYYGDFTSTPQDWPETMGAHVPKEDEDMIRQLAAKIPRPFNPMSVGIVLDDVHWYPGINTEPAILPGHGESSGRALSNRITLHKDFESGRKHNEINVTIERTKSFEELLDITDVLERLTAAFGVPRGSGKSIAFSPEELRGHRAADAEIKPLLEALQAELQPEKAVPADVPPIYHFHRTDWENGIVVMSAAETGPVSPKKAIRQAIKGTGYKYSYQPGGFYECTKRNEHNHLFRIGFGLAPQSHHLTNWISTGGYNFSCDVHTKDVDVANQAVVEEAVPLIVNLALQVEQRLTEPLARIYGKTPDWYDAE